MKIIARIFLTSPVLLMFFMWMGCDQKITAPEERFNVQATIEVQTIDPLGNPISVPVSFTTQNYRDQSELSDDVSISKIVSDGESGKAIFTIDYNLAETEYFTVIADVSEEKFESTNYWTAYFRSSDAPAKKIDVTMTVLVK